MSDNLKQFDLAKGTLKIFEDRGEDMNDVRHVLHYFYGGNHQALAAAMEELGYAIKSTVNNDGIIAERHEVISEAWRTSTLLGLCQLADTYGVEYDGWEASMTRQPAASAQAPTTAKPSGLLPKIFGKKK